jgi:predicted nucleic acid-binding protein
VLAELDYLIRRLVGDAEARSFLEDVADGAYDLHAFTNEELAVALRIINRYSDFSLGLADASVMVLAERYDCRDILTLDERDFRAVVSIDGKPFRLLPRDAR